MKGIREEEGREEGRKKGGREVNRNRIDVRKSKAMGLEH